MPVEPSEQPGQEAQPGAGAGADGVAPSQDAPQSAHTAANAPESPDTNGETRATAAETTAAQPAPSAAAGTTSADTVLSDTALARTTPTDPADAVETAFVPLPAKSTEAKPAAPAEDWRPSQGPEAAGRAAQPARPSQSPQTAAPAPPAAPMPPTAPATLPTPQPQASQTPTATQTAPAAPTPTLPMAPQQNPQNPQISGPIPTTPASDLPQAQQPAPSPSLPPTQPAAPQQPQAQQQPQQPAAPQPQPTFPFPTAGPGAALTPPPGAAAAAAAAQPPYPMAQPPAQQYQGYQGRYQGPPPVPPGQMPPWGWGQQPPPYAAYQPPQGQMPPQGQQPQYPQPPQGWPQQPLAQTFPESQSQTQPQQGPQTAPQPPIPPQPMQFAQQPMPPAQPQQSQQQPQQQAPQAAQPQAEAQQQQQPSYSYPYPSGATWEQQQAWAQGQQSGYPAAPPATRRSKLRLWLLIGIPALVVIIVAAVVIVVTQSSPPSSNVAKVTCNPQNLSTCLVQAPPAASKYATDWGSTTSVTAKDYVSQYADAAEQAEPEDATMVGTDGEKSIVHRDWYVGGNQVDIILLQFGTPQGAQAWGMDRSGDFAAQFRGAPFAVTGDSSTQAYAASSQNSSGDTQAGYATVVGTLVLEVHYASHGGLDKTDFENWAGTEYTSLQSAPPVTPSPSPSATASQNTTCPGAMSNCLMPRPAGYSPWTDPPHNATYSISGYTSQFTYANSNGQQTYEDLMTTDGVVSINDEDWINVGDGAEGWLALIETRSDQGAQDLLTKESGGGSLRPQSFSVSGFPAAVGTYSSSADSAGLFDGLVAAQVGTVYMEMWLTFANSYNVGTSQAWAVEELTLLTQNTSNLGIPIPQVSTPTLAAPSPASCASGADGCLMAVPGGATSTTSSSYDSNTSLTVNNYVDQYFPSIETYEGTWLNGDGATGASHETWIAGNGATADDILVKFGNAQEAQAAVHKLVGDQVEGTQSCSVSNVKDAYCMVQPQVVLSGSVPINVLAWKGSYMMDLETSQIGSADTADALNWALQQLAELPGA